MARVVILFRTTFSRKIKLLKHLFLDSFHVRTFQDKGKRLIANLEQHKQKVAKQLANGITDKERLALAIEYRTSTIDNIISMLEDDRSNWLSKAIDARDTISHYKGSFNLDEYKVEKIREEFEITLPKILDVYPNHFLEITYRNCIEFIF